MFKLWIIRRQYVPSVLSLCCYCHVKRPITNKSGKSATQTMSSEACVHCALPSSITSALVPTLSTSKLVTIETFSPALCFSAHTNNLLSFLCDVSTLTFCINVLHRLIVNGCVLSPMFVNRRRYNTIQYLPITSHTCPSLANSAICLI